MTAERRKIPYPSSRFPHKEEEKDKVPKELKIIEHVDLGGDDRRSHFSGERPEEPTTEMVEIKKEPPAGEHVYLGGDDRSANGFFADEHIEIE